MAIITLYNAVLFLTLTSNKPICCKKHDGPKRWTECPLADLQRVNITSLANATNMAKKRQEWQDIVRQMAPLNQTLE